jgi:hypothetical protein
MDVAWEQNPVVSVSECSDAVTSAAGEAERFTVECRAA